MKDDLKRIKFVNTKRPNSGFDLLHLEELLVKEVDHDITQAHKIEFFHLLLITDGSGFHTIDFTDYSYQKGTLLTIRKDQIHRFFRSPSARGFMLLFTEEFLASHFSKAEVLRAFHLFNELLTSPRILLNPDDYDDVLNLVNIMENEYESHEDEFSTGIIRSALHMLVIKLFRIKSSNQQALTQRKYLDEFIQLQQLIEQHCFETKKVQDYAQMMYCSTKTLNNICRAILHKSAKEVIDDILMTQIKRLLINTTSSITEIAYSSGFEETTNLYKYFKKHTGSSPEVFRRAHT